MALFEAVRGRLGEMLHFTRNEISPVLPQSIKEKSHHIAELVRKNGEQRHGPTWAEGYVVLPGDRIAHLQHSISQVNKKTPPVDDMLTVDILPLADDPTRVWFSYFLKEDRILEYRIQPKDGKPTIAVDFTLKNVLRPIDQILQLVENAADKITQEIPAKYYRLLKPEVLARYVNLAQS